MELKDQRDLIEFASTPKRVRGQVPRVQITLPTITLVETTITLPIVTLTERQYAVATDGSLVVIDERAWPPT